MWIKVVIIVVLFAVVAVMLRAQGSRNLAIRRLAMVLFTLAAAVSVVFPDTWTAMASFLGVGRGTDLLLYLFILITLAFIVATHLHFRAVETQITTLARRIALAEAPRPDQATTIEPEADRPDPEADRPDAGVPSSTGDGQPNGR